MFHKELFGRTHPVNIAFHIGAVQILEINYRPHNPFQTQHNMADNGDLSIAPLSGKCVKYIFW